MSTLKYKGYIASIEFDAEDKILVGRFIGIDDIVSFHAEDAAGIEPAFHEMVEHYIEVSERTGRPAQKPYSGKMTLRVDPALHAAVARAAELGHTSINQFVARCLQNEVTL